jgi:hypothetical protein
MKNDTYIKIKDVFNMAVHENVLPEHVKGLTLHAKCTLIHDIVDALRRKEPQSKYGTARHTRDSLVTIVDSFASSDALADFQERKGRSFLNEIERNENGRSILNNIAAWSDVETDKMKETLIATSKLHLEIYTQGICGIVPVSYLFGDKDKNKQRFGSLNMGGFVGNLKNGTGKIRVVDNENAQFHLADRALSTMHHQTTHAVQFCLANAFHHGRMSPNHPLFDDAKMFHAIEVKNAFVPSAILKNTEQHAYVNQVHEILAEAEGKKISANLIELAQ